jgi:alpha-1,6-mannosyltransferase
MSRSADPGLCRWLGAAGAVTLSAGGLVSGALPLRMTHIDAGLVAVYFGLILLIGAWWQLRGVAVPPRWMTHTLILWAAPLALGPPLFSRDVYSYIAQGTLVLRDVDAYRFGPATLGGPLAAEVPAIWQQTPAPYGPIFLRAAAGVASLSRADIVLGVLGMRLVALIGVGLLVAFLPRLARACGVAPSAALWLGTLNPLVLLHFVAGAHNDALMVGLLTAGLALAAGPAFPQWRFPAAAALVTAAALVKAPAALGLLAVLWLWPGPRLLAAIKTAAIALGTTGVVTVLSGTGLGWLSVLDTPISASNWSLSSAIGRLHSAISHAETAVPMWRGIGLAAVAVTGLVFWIHNRRAPVYALGLTLAALAILGPATRPWYLLWGLIPIAAAAPDGQARRWAAGIGAVSAIIVLPDGYPPTVRQLALAVLGGALALPALLAGLYGCRTRGTS